MRVVVVTPPDPVVSLALAKQHLRIDHDDDDALIDIYIAAAQATIDGPAGWLGRCIGLQTLELLLDGFVSPIWSWAYDAHGLFWGGATERRITLPCPPLISVTSITYVDQNGGDQALPSASYLATAAGSDVAFNASFPLGQWRASTVRIRYEAGYTQVPAAISAAILLMISDLYANRGTVETGVRAAAVSIPMTTTVETLLGPYRVYG